MNSASESQGKTPTAKSTKVPKSTYSFTLFHVSTQYFKAFHNNETSYDGICSCYCGYNVSSHG